MYGYIDKRDIRNAVWHKTGKRARDSMVYDNVTVWSGEARQKAQATVFSIGAYISGGLDGRDPAERWVKRQG
jgi:hypothetical protein